MELFGSAVDDAEINIGEADDPAAVLEFGNADRLASQGLGDKDKGAAPFDFTSGTDPPDGMICVVPGRGRATFMRNSRAVRPMCIC